MFGLGPMELFLILAIVVVLFGASRLPQIGKGVGEGIKNFRDAVRKPAEIDVTPEKKPGESPER
jgi:sec-independent protein translocase protein TatA